MKALLTFAVSISIDIVIAMAASSLFNVDILHAIVGYMLARQKLQGFLVAHLYEKGKAP